jgi:hypothetical protein
MSKVASSPSKSITKTTPGRVQRSHKQMLMQALEYGARSSGVSGSPRVLGTHVGQGPVFESMAQFWELPAADRKVFKTFSIDYNLIATAEEQALMSRGIFEPFSGIPGDLQGVLLTDGPVGTNFGGCNTIIGAVRARVHVPSEKGTINVAFLTPPDPLPDPLLGTPNFDGIVPLGGLPAGADPEAFPAHPEARSGVIWHGHPAQMAASYFLRSHDLVVTQCGVVIARIPLCDIATFECGVQFQGASDGSDPADYWVRKANDRLLAILSDMQAIPQNTEGDAGVEPVQMPATYGAPKAECAGLYNFLRPIIALSDFPLVTTIEVNSRCRHDAEIFAEWIANATGLDDITTPSASWGPDTENGQAGRIILKSGSFCIIIEYLGCQLTAEGLAKCWNEFMRMGDEPVCKACWPHVQSSCAGVKPLTREVRNSAGGVEIQYLGENKSALLPPAYLEAMRQNAQLRGS